jgi:hypothetical protein
MKKRKHMKTRQLKNTAYRQSAKPRVVEMQPEELAAYVRRAEKEALPIIKETHLPPGAALFVLAQYTQALVTGDSRLSVESAMNVSTMVLALWQEGIYLPSSEYPYSFEETMSDVQGEPRTNQDYESHFRPITQRKENGPPSHRQVAGGIVQHPETHLWQIWMLIDGPCEYFGAYRDPMAAQKNLEAMIDAIRRRAAPSEIDALSKRVTSQADRSVKQIPFEMMEYLLDHIEQYMISL